MKRAARRSPSTSRRSPVAKGRVRFAVVGLGHIAQVAVLPAFHHARRLCTLAALVSDEPRKLLTLGRRYHVPLLETYDGFDALLRSGAVDAVYIALPNDMHEEFTLRAARAGVHVLCEKPLATTSIGCARMVSACERAGVLLMTAYRLHFERANLSAVEVVRSGRIGDPRFFHALFGMQVRDLANIRLEAERGGGPLFDLGVYCINAARYVFRAEPIEALAMDAWSEEDRFDEVPEMTSALLRFPGERLASFTCSFGSGDVSTYRVVGTRGDLVLDPAFEYAEGLECRLSIGGRTTSRTYAKRDQFAPELLHFAECVLGRRPLESNGREGWADVRVIEAIKKSALTGRAVPLGPFQKANRPTIAQERRVRPVRKPGLVMARPAGDE